MKTGGGSYNIGCGDGCSPDWDYNTIGGGTKC